ncbi:MAG: DUF4829 domain-containing protein [Bacillota bacterium]|nr:DUF4829 domain-containing protein [Bacillota bacterium]
MLERLITITLVISLIMTGCNVSELEVDKILSPEETVEEYFKYWVAKDKNMMNTFVTEGNKNVVYELDRMTHLELISVEAGDERCRWNDAWYEEPYEYTCLNVTFAIEYIDGHGAGFSNGTYEWQYYLIRPSEDSNWLIVMWGVA